MLMLSFNSLLLLDLPLMFQLVLVPIPLLWISTRVPFEVHLLAHVVDSIEDRIALLRRYNSMQLVKFPEAING